ncbi:hypothetical protein GGF32_006495 [Allomyces javanicus]|nr:hypothetical protein GGF32_006495 [Allomyces javanicus]
MDVVTLEFRQGHPVWSLLARGGITARAPFAKRLIVHIVRVVDVRAAVEDLAKGLAAIAAAGAPVGGNPLPLPVDVVLMDSVSLALKQPFEEMLAVFAQQQQTAGGVWDWCEYY